MSPTAMTASIPTMKTAVGNRKALALSPRPRRFSTVMIANMPRHKGTVREARLEKAEVSAPTPAAIETATVRV